jgi:hypothetical protein
MLLMDHHLFSFVNSPWSDKGHYRIYPNIKQPAHPLIQDDRASVLTNILRRQAD